MFRFQPRLEKRERKNWCSPVLKAQWTFEHLWEIHEETFRQEKNKLWHGNITPSKKSNACGLARSASGGEEKVSITNTKPGVLFCKQLLQRQSRFTKANFLVIKGQSSAMVEWAFDLIWIIVMNRTTETVPSPIQRVAGRKKSEKPEENWLWGLANPWATTNCCEDFTQVISIFCLSAA